MSNRNMWTVVAKREIAVKLTDKAFLGSFLVTLLIILVGFAFLIFGPASKPVKIGVLSSEGQSVVDVINAARDRKPWVTSTFADPDSAAKAVKNNDIDLAIVKESDGWRLYVTSIDQASSSLISQLSTAISTSTLSDNARAAGLDTAKLLEKAKLSVTSTSDNNSDPEKQFALRMSGIIFAVAFFMVAIVFGLQIAASVVKEKESRVVEILSAAISHSQLLLGKIIGNSVLALSQVIVYFTVTLICVSFTEYSDLLPLLATGSGWFMIFFVSGFLALSCLWAASGAMATQYEDIQQTATPINFLLMGGYFAAFAAPAGMKAALSYVPIISSVLMPGRLLDGSATWLQALISLALNLLFMVFAIHMGARLYRRGILQTSGTLKWRGAFSKES